MDKLFQPEYYQEVFQNILQWVQENVLITATLIQLGTILALALLTYILLRPLRSYLFNRLESFLKQETHVSGFLHTLLHLLIPFCLFLLLWVSVQLAKYIAYPHFFLSLSATLLAAWVVIRLASSFILNKLWAGVLGVVLWTVVALHILGWLTPTISFLETMGFRLGEVKLTALSLIKAFIVLMILMKIGMWLSAWMDRRLANIPALSPSSRVLLVKTLKIAAIAVIILIVLNSVGIDFTALAVLSGAIGVGIGFGLQKVAANLISGIILLLDKSIKPGDVIQVGDVYGWITELRARFVSVVTRDGFEFLIPNEDLITQKVINWSFSNRQVRLRQPIGISYKSDPHRAMELILNAVQGSKRVLQNPPPVCLMTGYGDSSVDLELRFWINDPQNGLNNVKSEILVKVWDQFKEHGIEIPFPQRDVHLDVQPGTRPLPVRMSPENTDKD